MSGLGVNYGVLEMGFGLDGRGRSVLHHLYRKVPMVVQQALYFDETLPLLPCVYTLSSGGPTLDGDRYRVRVDLAAGAMAHISTGAATLVASMVRDRAEMRQSITLAEGSYLEWLPRPIIPAAHSRYRSSTKIRVAPSASLFWSEVVACGRLHSGERFLYDSLDLETTVAGSEGEVFLRERLTLCPSLLSPNDSSLLGDFTHFSTSIIISPAEVTDGLYEAIRPQLSPHLRVSIARLEGSRGVVIRALGRNSESLLSLARGHCSLLRQWVKGVPMAREFPWR